MNYRNIDQDVRLLKMAERYWTEDQLTKEQVHWVLSSEGYSQKEIDNAIADYYSIHLRSNWLLHPFIGPFVFHFLMIVLVYQIYSLMASQN